MSTPSTDTRRLFDVHRGEAPPSVAADRPVPPAATLRKWLRDMMLIREFEVRCMQAYQDKKIGGFCHVYIGQEAVAVGCVAAMKPEDPLVTAYRDHGHALARGMTANACMAEMFGRVDGCAKGKGGSMHMFDKPNNMFGGHGIVGAQTPLGAGLAFATKYEDEVMRGGRNGRVTLCFLGDGALNQGALHEAMNMAGLMDLPVVFVVENNGYSMGTSIHRGTTMAHELKSKAVGYGMDAAVVDGMDVLETYWGMKHVIDDARARSRPWFVDMRCYRYKGHSMSDPRKYRTRDEEEAWEAGDPIGTLERFMLDRGMISADEAKEMLKGVKTEARDSITFADASPMPEPGELFTDVYMEPWGPYPGSSQPSFMGGAPNTPSFRAIDPKGEVL
ncbi:MAG: pyruvate dehydrogenase (acetyl-transferring) E1 component subunit alpha [Planctomycetes bacterium]|nr:pyruvate dehydrogenase (acetyl-transferring) E1 component subunit alpha [Planctomycetota bacterium]